MPGAAPTQGSTLTPPVCEMPTPICELPTPACGVVTPGVVPVICEGEAVQGRMPPNPATGALGAG